MIKEIRIPDKVKVDPLALASWMQHLQEATNRHIVGGLRYGDTPKKRQKYMSRMKKEMEAYEKTGNCEHLLNIVVYTWCEREAPENKKFHFDNSVDSVTRAEFGV